MKQIIIIFLLAILTTNSQSQIPNSQTPIDSATMYLTGTFKQYNPQRAFQINLQNANNGNAKAMNAVAMHYTKGLGVDSNFNLAVYWFNQAAINGYTKALVNLGMLYKHKAVDSSGYSIACNYFNQALQVNEPSALFAMGYMYYKGLGCTQSYSNALNLFNQGIALNQSSCMYFKGLCYRFGYGVNENTDSASYYIDKAAMLGYKQANAELYNNNPNAAARKQGNSTTNNPKPQTPNNEFARIEKSNKSINLSGEFVGNLNQYDYSGKKLIAQIPITLQVSTSNNIITGNLIFNNSQSIQLKAIQQGNQLIFSQTQVPISLGRGVRGDASKRQTKLLFRSANLQLETKNDSNYLTGTLQLFNTNTHETDKPINIKLIQRQTPNTKQEQLQTPNNVLIYPNPTTGSFTVSFNQSKPSAVKINIYNTQGQIVYTKIFEQLLQGKQSVSIPNFKGISGIYQVVVNANNQQQTTAFIKE